MLMSTLTVQWIPVQTLNTLQQILMHPVIQQSFIKIIKQ